MAVQIRLPYDSSRFPIENQVYLEFPYKWNFFNTLKYGIFPGERILFRTNPALLKSSFSHSLYVGTMFAGWLQLKNTVSLVISQENHRS
jgi:hypothetical protein